MHALYLQQAVCILPDSEVSVLELEKLASRIQEFGGEATLLQVLAKNEAWEQGIQARFQSNRNAKHEKLQEEIKKFVDEIHFEEYRKRFTVEELEELEEKFETLERWFEKLKQKDEPVGSRISLRTKAQLKDAANHLDLFAGKVEQIEKKPVLLSQKTSRGKRRIGSGSP